MISKKLLSKICSCDVSDIYEFETYPRIKAPNHCFYNTHYIFLPFYERVESVNGNFKKRHEISLSELINKIKIYISKNGYKISDSYENNKLTIEIFLKNNKIFSDTVFLENFYSTSVDSFNIIIKALEIIEDDIKKATYF